MTSLPARILPLLLLALVLSTPMPADTLAVNFDLAWVKPVKAEMPSTAKMPFAAAKYRAVNDSKTLNRWVFQKAIDATQNALS